MPEKTMSLCQGQLEVMALWTLSVQADIKYEEVDQWNTKLELDIAIHVQLMKLFYFKIITKIQVEVNMIQVCLFYKQVSGNDDEYENIQEYFLLNFLKKF